jgi:Kef-type K+ transport system membrane component KefB
MFGSHPMTVTEIYLVALLIIFTVPYLVWRLARTDFFAPLVVVQIVTGILLGPGVLGASFPEYYQFVFAAPVVQSLNGIAWWAVMIFVWLAGIELDLDSAWQHRRESTITAGLALGVPLATGCAVAAALLATSDGWLGPNATPWQFVLGIGMCCSVTALPILVLFLQRLAILREPLGQRILRYASMDDLAVWAVLALILADWARVGRQTLFLTVFLAASWAFRRLMVRLPQRDRWFSGLVWLAAVALGADWSGLHFMVGAFLAGAVMDRDWFEHRELDAVRDHVLLLLMPVFFLSTGLRTDWQLGGAQVFVAALALLAAGVAGKLLGAWMAGRILGWRPGEDRLIGWLLQTKALIMIIFANVLLDKELITSTMFTALLLMAVLSTMLTIPMATPQLARLRERAGKSG